MQGAGAVDVTVQQQNEVAVAAVRRLAVRVSRGDHSRWEQPEVPDWHAWMHRMLKPIRARQRRRRRAGSGARVADALAGKGSRGAIGGG